MACIISRFNLAWISAISTSRKLMICVDGQKSTKENVYSHRWALLSWVQLLHCTTEKNDRKKNVLCSQHVNCNKFSNTGKPHYSDSHLEIQTPCSGLSKVSGCQRKSPPTWLVSAGYSSWHFFTDGVFQMKYPWTGRLLWQLSCLLQNFLTSLLIIMDSFLHPWEKPLHFP